MSIESELAKRDRLLAEKSARIRELEHMVETRSESIRNLTELLDKSHARIRELEGERSSRWHELFGTPESAAWTLSNVCQFTHGGELCDRCQCYLFGDCDRMLRLRSGRSIYDALLEWLRGDA